MKPRCRSFASCQRFHHRWSLLAALAGVLLLESSLANQSASAVIGSSAHGQQISSFCALHNAAPWPCRHLFDKGFWNITRVGNKHRYSFVYFKGGCDTRPFLPQHSVVNRKANPSEDDGNLHVLMIGDSTDRMVSRSVCELNNGKMRLLNRRNSVCELPMGVTVAHFYIFGIEDPALGNTPNEEGYVMDEDKPFGLKTSQRLDRLLSSPVMEALHNRIDVVTVQSCLWDLSEPLNILSTVRPEYVAYYRRQIAEVGRVLTQYFPGAQRYWKTSGAVASWYSRDTDPTTELEMFEKGRSRRRRKNKSPRWTTANTRTRRSQVALTNAAYMAVVEDGNSGFRGLVDAFALTEGVTWFAPDGRHYRGLLNKIYFEHLLNRVCTELAEDEAMPSPQ